MNRTLSKPLLGTFAGLTLLTAAVLGVLYQPEARVQAPAMPVTPAVVESAPTGLKPAVRPPVTTPALTRAPTVRVPETLKLARELARSDREEELFQLKTLLGDPESAEGLAIARQLLQDSDARVRGVGVDILTAHSLTTPDVHQEVIRLLSADTDSATLTRLLNNLDAPIDFYGKDAEMSHALHNLLSHQDPDVRSQAVLQLLQWDDYATLEGYLYQALNDTSAEVRLSAATVVSLIDTRSSTLKGALLSLRNNPQESRDMRESIDAAISRIDDYNRDYIR